jgi:glyoxylase-like metal-dependent hydrolase (beta-lactamase superfamily II)/8-oxo-dGTP pyrophosphatase MutT (NUDIX family)
VNAIIEAASVLLTRGPDNSEVLIVRRSESLRFFGGYLAFPGGKVATDDADHGPDPRRAAAIRELFEETGVLLARRADGSQATGKWDDGRKELLAGRLSFAEFLRREQLHLDASDLVDAGSLVTPPFSPFRFDTTFFVARMPEGQTADVWPGELTEEFWTTPAALLDNWTRGESLVTPPALTLLELIRGVSILELPSRLKPLLARLAAGALPPICFLPGVHMLPLKTVGLPPTAYTNAFLVGTDPRWLIDPGAHEQAEQQRLFDALDLLLGGQRLAGVVLTHHHPDHVGGVTAVVERYRVPVLAHPTTQTLLAGKIRVDRTLTEEGRDQLPLGTAPDGSGEWHLQVLHTPGHAAGHIAFYERRYRFLLAGDLVSTLSSIVIAPPDGDLSVYLDTLRRMQEVDVRMLLPAHGSPSIKPRGLLSDAVAHRLKREQQLLSVLAEGPASAATLAERLYEGLPEALRPLARWQVLAGLEKLRREGRAVPSNGDDSPWRLAVPLASIG